MKYVVCVLFLLACCTAQTGNSQSPIQNSSDTLYANLASDSNPSTRSVNEPVGVRSISATYPDAPGVDDQTTGQTTTSTSSSKSKKSSEEEPAWGWARGVSVGVGYQSTTGNPGIGGVNVGAGWRFKDQIELCTDMDFGSETTIIGAVTSKSKRQNYLFGGRYYLGKKLMKHSRFEPFGHLMYGVSHESVNTTTGIPVTNTISSSQTSWAWDFGGGVDYLLSKHWALRGRADWLKTHFNNTGQSHFKWVAGFWYSFTARSLAH